jgi:hypothetical protein
MERAHRNMLDVHPKLFINTQVLWIIVGTGLLDKWLPRTVANWKAGETYNLPQSIAHSVIGLVVVISGFILINSAVNGLVSRIPSDPEPRETERR